MQQLFCRHVGIAFIAAFSDPFFTKCVDGGFINIRDFCFLADTAGKVKASFLINSTPDIFGHRNQAVPFIPPGNTVNLNRQTHGAARHAKYKNPFAFGIDHIVNNEDEPIDNEYDNQDAPEEMDYDDVNSDPFSYDDDNDDPDDYDPVGV